MRTIQLTMKNFTEKTAMQLMKDCHEGKDRCPVGAFDCPFGVERPGSLQCLHMVPTRWEKLLERHKKTPDFGYNTQLRVHTCQRGSSVGMPQSGPEFLFWIPKTSSFWEEAGTYPRPLKAYTRSNGELTLASTGSWSNIRQIYGELQGNEYWSFFPSMESKDIHGKLIDVWVLPYDGSQADAARIILVLAEYDTKNNGLYYKHNSQWFPVFDVRFSQEEGFEFESYDGWTTPEDGDAFFLLPHTIPD